MTGEGAKGVPRSRLRAGARAPLSPLAGDCRILEIKSPSGGPGVIDLRDDLVTALAGRYDIERELGHGGMAIVYLARDARHERHVAIKVLRPELATSLGAERFLREINIAARLTHPNILALHDSGNAAGMLYFVMPHVEG